MREVGEVRKDFGDDAEAAAPYVGHARTLLGVLKDRMARGGLTQLSQTTQLADGTIITVASRMGQDTVRISTVPAGTPSRAESPLWLPPSFVADEAPPVEVPDETFPVVIGTTEVYSQTYMSSVLLGAVMDKTTNVTYLAYAWPNVDQTFGLYSAPVPNTSQLVRLNRGLKEVTRSTIAAPDWGGQFAYDLKTDCFYLNVFAATDSRYLTSKDLFQGGGTLTPAVPTPHRSLLQITKGGAQTVMSEPLISVTDASYQNYLWGTTNYWLSDTILGRNPNGSGKYGIYATVGKLYGTIGTNRDAQQFPLSQPSTSGLIAAMYQGDVNLTDGSAPEIHGYPILWSTASQSIVWRGTALGNWRAVWNGGGDWSITTRCDPWAHITPAGNAVFSVAGVLKPVQIGTSALDIGTPPTDIVDIVVTKSEKQAYAISKTGAYRYSAGVWSPLVLKGTGGPRSVLHDAVTDAVAIVMNDASGAWIFNGHTPTGQPVGPFKLVFARPPTRDPKMIYPTQFIGGALLITYALPWDGTAGKGGGSNSGSFVPWVVEQADTDVWKWPWTAAPRGMPAHYYPEQRAPGWRADLGRQGVGYAINFTPTPTVYDTKGIRDCADDGSVDPFPWVIGRYDIGQLQVSQ